MTVIGTSVLRRTRCGRSQASQREMPGGSVERMISSNRASARLFSMAFIGSGSPTAPSAVAPISRRRCNSVSRLDLASTMPCSRVRTPAALGSSSGSTGKAQLSALKSLMRWIVGAAGTSTQNWPNRGTSDRGSRRAAPGRRECGSPLQGIDAQLGLLGRSAEVRRCGQPMARQGRGKRRASRRGQRS